MNLRWNGTTMNLRISQVWEAVRREWVEGSCVAFGRCSKVSREVYLAFEGVFTLAVTSTEVRGACCFPNKYYPPRIEDSVIRVKKPDLCGTRGPMIGTLGRSVDTSEVRQIERTGFLRLHGRKPSGYVPTCITSLSRPLPVSGRNPSYCRRLIPLSCCWGPSNRIFRLWVNVRQNRLT